MGLSDKFKNLAKQAQDAVADHADKLHDAVDTVGVAVNDKTQGKYASKIAKVGEKTGGAIDKLSGTEESSPEAGTGAEATSDSFAGSEQQASAETVSAEPAAAGAPDAAQFATDSSYAPQAPASAPTTPPPAEGFPSFDE
jgi:antitoxin protein of toxin-antitoxin system